MKTVLITGCSTGIGFDTAITLAKKGYRVLATARKKKDVEHLGRLGLESFVLDVSTTKGVEKGIKELKKRTKELYAVFNNAGFGVVGAIEDLSRKAFEEQFATNTFGALELTNKIIPMMREKKRGKIIFNSSCVGFLAIPYRGAYTASKFAMEAAADCLRMELPHYIKVSLIEPGPIKSHFRQNCMPYFKKYVDMKKTHHAANYKKATKRLAATDTPTPFTLPESAVTKKVLTILKSKNPKARYYVTLPTYLFGFAKRFFPTKLLDYFVKDLF